MFRGKSVVMAQGETVAEFVTWLDVLAALPLHRAVRVRICRQRGNETYSCDVDLASEEQEDRTAKRGDGAKPGEDVKGG